MIRFNDAYLNRSPHRRPRQHKPEFVIWHETAGPSARSALDWMQNPASQVSWDFLIDVEGTVYRCNDAHLSYTWHAGVSKARGYTTNSTRDEVNLRCIGVEVQGENDGSPITTAQRDSIINLMLYLRDEFDIPVEREYHLAHKEVALPKGRKSDPRSYSVDVALQLAQAAAAAEQPRPALDLAQLEQELNVMAEHVRQLGEQLGVIQTRVALARRKGDRS